MSIRIMLDTHRIGDIAAECGIAPKATARPDGSTEISVEILSGSGRIEFWARVPEVTERRANIAPPTVDSLAGVKYE